MTPWWNAGSPRDRRVRSRAASADDPIPALDLICAPHALGWTDQMFETMGLTASDAARAVRKGTAPKNIVNGDVATATAFTAKLTRLEELARR